MGRAPVGFLKKKDMGYTVSLENEMQSFLKMDEVICLIPNYCGA
jgi:hypothetical protein